MRRGSVDAPGIKNLQGLRAVSHLFSQIHRDRLGELPSC